ncbi:MAG: glycosyltransferase [Microthrixaceae bacterium]|nr:glycosyltransferase [Microthrixaceae bacterium]
MVSGPSTDGCPTADPIVTLELAVVVPCHNVEHTLAEQLESLVTQRWEQPWGIIVVDNNSTDNTLEVAMAYVDRGVRVVQASAGRGVAYARNTGIRASNARAVALCDGDDVVHSGWVEAMGNAVSEHDLVSGSLETTSLNPDYLARSRPMGVSDRLNTFGSTPFASGGNCAMRVEIFEHLGGFDEHFDGLEDIEFSLRANKLGIEVVLEREAKLAYRMRPEPGDTWRQGQFYGAGRPLLIQRALELGLDAPSRWQGIRSWTWLLLKLPRARTRAGRYQLLWVLAFRLGVLKRAVQLRRPYI